MEATVYPTNVTSYIGIDWPDFETPEDWCTGAGAEHAKEVGAQIIQNFFHDAPSIKVKIISDTVERDVTTSFQLAEGMSEAAQTAQIPISGLDSPEYDPILFDPLTPIEDSDMEGNGGTNQLCQFTNDNVWAVLNSNINSQLNDVTKRPSISLGEAIDIVEKHAGVGQVGSMKDIIQDPTHPLHLNNNLHELRGPINVIHMIAEAVFYAKLSSIGFMPNITTPEIFQLLEWHYYKRNVLAARNVMSASAGSVLLHRILQFLSGENDDPDDHDTDTVTIFVGHDGDLDHLATVLDIDWSFPLPYTENSQLPTPPMTGLYFANSDGNDSFENQYTDISILTPEFYEPDSTDPNAGVNLSGKMGQFAVKFEHNLQPENVRNDTATRIIVSAQDNSSYGSCQVDNHGNFLGPIEVLRCQMNVMLDSNYPLAKSCYEAAKARYPETTLPPTSSPTISAPVAPPSKAIGPTPAPTLGSPVTTLPTSTSGAGMPTHAPKKSNPQPQGVPTQPTSAPTVKSNTHHPKPSFNHPTNHHPNVSASSTQQTQGNGMVWAAVALVAVLAGVIFRKKIAQQLGLADGGMVSVRRRQGAYSNPGHDLDFSVEMI